MDGGSPFANNTIDVRYFIDIPVGRFLVPRLQSFGEQYPELKVRLDPTNLVNSFDGADIDLAIRFGLGDYPNLESRLLIDDKYVLVSHPRLLRKNMKVDDLYDLPLLEEQGPNRE